MVESGTGDDGVTFSGTGTGTGSRETTQCHCRPIASCLSRSVECIGRFMTLCNRWLHSIIIKPRPWSDLPNDILISIASRLSRVEFIGRFMTGWLHLMKPRGCGEYCHRPWSDLPNDILISIASRLGRVECIRFMNVCKGWLHSIKPHGHRGNHLKPCLLAMEKEDLGWLSLYTPFPSKTYKLRIPELKNTIFIFSKDGWILLSKITGPSRLFLLNLLTGAEFDPGLPAGLCTSSPGCFYGFCFTSTPGSSDFMLLVICSILVDTVTIFTYRPSTQQKWTKECYENSSWTSFRGVSCNPIFYKGKFYCLDNYGHLGVFDPVRKNWTTIGDRPNYFVVNPPPPDPIDEFFRSAFFRSAPAFRDFPYKSFMVDLDGEELISVFVNKRKSAKEEVHIFRLDFCKMGWEKVDSLGTGELFVGLSTSTISTVELPYGSWNKLYFPGFKSNLTILSDGLTLKDEEDFHTIDKELKTWSYYYEAYSLETKEYDPYCSSLWRDPHQFTWIELPMSKWESIYHSKWKRM